MNSFQIEPYVFCSSFHNWCKQKPLVQSGDDIRVILSFKKRLSFKDEDI